MFRPREVRLTILRQFYGCRSPPPPVHLPHRAGFFRVTITIEHFRRGSGQSVVHPRDKFIGKANVTDRFDGEMIATNALLLDFERIHGYKLSRHVQNACAFNQPYLTAVSAPRQNSRGKQRRNDKGKLTHNKDQKTRVGAA